MANVREGVSAGEWAKHLRKYGKRQVAKASRKNAKNIIKEER